MQHNLSTSACVVPFLVCPTTPWTWFLHCWHYHLFRSAAHYWHLSYRYNSLPPRAFIFFTPATLCHSGVTRHRHHRTCDTGARNAPPTMVSPEHLPPPLPPQPSHPETAVWTFISVLPTSAGAGVLRPVGMLRRSRQRRHTTHIWTGPTATTTLLSSWLAFCRLRTPPVLITAYAAYVEHITQIASNAKLRRDTAYHRCYLPDYRRAIRPYCCAYLPHHNTAGTHAR